MDSKRQHGQYFTKKNVFKLEGFLSWFKSIPNNLTCVEPFAGDKDIQRLILELPKSYQNKIKKWSFYDIEPRSKDIIQNDSIQLFPKGHNLTISNPPYLAKNSAKRRGLNFPNINYDDLYKVSLSQALESCDYVAYIIPESFLTTSELKERLHTVISINFKAFDDTEHPVCLALFSKEKTNSYKIYIGDTYLGTNIELLANKIKYKGNYKIQFNDVNGQISLLAVDSTSGRTAKFADKKEVDRSEIKISSRARTLIYIDSKIWSKILKKITEDKFISLLNKKLNKYRDETHDVFMTNFKGLRKDGFYRRRIDFKLAKEIIISTIDDILD